MRRRDRPFEEPLDVTGSSKLWAGHSADALGANEGSASGDGHTEEHGDRDGGAVKKGCERHDKSP